MQAMSALTNEVKRELFITREREHCKKLISWFNHRVVTLVADKLRRQYL